MASDTRVLHRLLAEPPELPVVDGLARIQASAGNLVISAPPGSGKTTLAPVAVAADLSPATPKVLVVQPRRIAARAAARRIAQLLGEPLGQTVGYRVRGDVREGACIEMITPGVLLRMLHSDPELSGVGAVIVDEIHERGLQTDLATAFLLDVQENLRGDLRIIAMSATLNAERVASLLDAQCIDVPGVIYPVEIHDRIGPRPLKVLTTGSIVVDDAYLDHVANVVREAAAGEDSVLVFLPGVREINAIADRVPFATIKLHGQASQEDQDRALDDTGKRVILATAIAESSLTVPGVRVVVDAGLSREARWDPQSGIGGLVTVHASQASMSQRAGRAGRQGPGQAYRTMSFAAAIPAAQPEILSGDITDALLQAAVWGAPDFAGLRLLDEPRPGFIAGAAAHLHALGMIDDDHRPTSLGKRAGQLPLPAASARALLTAPQILGESKLWNAAVVTAFLGLGERVQYADLTPAIRTSAEARREARRFGARKPDTPPALDDDTVATVVGLARPEWIARKRGAGYQLANGTGAILPEASPLQGSEWLAIADLGKAQGRSDAMIYAAVPINAEDAQVVAAGLLRETVTVDRRGGTVVGTRTSYLGAIELRSERVKNLSAADIVSAWLEDVRVNGLAVLPWSESTTLLRERLAFLHRALGEPWPAMSDEALLHELDAWLAPFITRDHIDLRGALQALLPWPEASRLDELAPERIAAPLGSARVDYSLGSPRARMKLQEAFGWTDTPVVAGVPVVLELLSPAGRPLAITADLASFWAGPYQDVRADMRGRYPKHPWPEDPTTAEPTRRTKNRAEKA